MSPPQHDLLLTGATGFLGHYLLAGLLQRPDVRCRVLLRPPLQRSRARLVNRLAELGMDLEPLFHAGRLTGLEGELPDRVDSAAMRGVGTIIHAAGNTCFDADASGQPLRTNVEGTRMLLQAAASAGVRHFLFVSSAYVCGDQSIHIPERIETRPPVFCNDYEHSKWQAEQLVWAWRHGSRAVTICRPSILFGDRRSGRTTSFTGIYVIARATEILSRAVADAPSLDRHHIPLRIPGGREAKCNLVPVDWAAARILDCVSDVRLQGRVHHLTNPAPPDHAEIKSWLEEYFDIGGGAFSHESWPFADPNHYEELFYALGNVVHDYFREGLFFESGWAEKQDTARRLVDRACFLQGLAYAHSQNWGRTRTPSMSPDRHQEWIDPGWYFEEFLPSRMPGSSVARIHGLTTTVRFAIGSPAQEWVCRFDHGKLIQVLQGHNSLTEEFGYRVTQPAFHQMVTGARPLQAVFFGGEADMFGDIERALRMVSIMAEFIKEFPAPNA